MVRRTHGWVVPRTRARSVFSDLGRRSRTEHPKVADGDRRHSRRGAEFVAWRRIAVRWPYYNTESFPGRPGHAQLARTPDPAGSSEHFVGSETVDWFPHLSPDSLRASCIAFPPSTQRARLALRGRTTSTRLTARMGISDLTGAERGVVGREPLTATCSSKSSIGWRPGNARPAAWCPGRIRT